MPHLEQIEQLQLAIDPLEERITNLRVEIDRRIALIQPNLEGLTGRALIRASQDFKSRVASLNELFERQAIQARAELVSIGQKISELQQQQDIIEVISQPPEPIDSITTITPIQEPQNGINLKTLAIIGAVILLLI